MVWKNGSPIALTGNTVSSAATAVIVKGIDVYVAGYSWVAPGHYIATYWRNGTQVDLTDGSANAIAYSISLQ
jgi:hypothetical protein